MSSLESPQAYNTVCGFTGELVVVTPGHGGTCPAHTSLCHLVFGGCSHGPMPKSILAALEWLVGSASRVLFLLALALTCCVTSHSSLHLSFSMAVAGLLASICNVSVPTKLGMGTGRATRWLQTHALQQGFNTSRLTLLTRVVYSPPAVPTSP